MRIEFHADGQALRPGLREHAESTLRRSLNRFNGRVGRVVVYVWDANGPRGGEDKGVRVIVALAPFGEVLVRETGANAFAAVSEAVSRARHAVREELRRRRARGRRNARPARPRRQVAAIPSAVGV